MGRKKNTYDTPGPSRPLGGEISLTEAPGVYGTNPDPGLREYKQSMGKDTLPIKFEEGNLGARNPNPMETQIKRATAAEPTTSKVNKTPNRYESAIKKNVIGKIK
jgi:hypothetical protein